MVSDWNRDRHVDADHADIYTCREFTGGVAVTGENGDAVSILMLAGKRQRLLKIVGANHLENRTENFFLVAFHVGFDMVEQLRPYKEDILMALQLEAATVKSEDRRGGKEWVSTCRSRVSP